MKRPGRWDLLGESGDPVDADLYAVGRQAAHYGGVAEAIREQTARLRAIGSGSNELVGKYAGSLREKAGALADDLGRTHGRYAAVASALTTYYPALDTALTESWGALQDAVAADEAARSAGSLPDPTPQQGKPLTAEQKQQAGRRSAALGAAAADLGAAKARLARALGELDTVARKVAGDIRAGFHDGLTDSFWDRFTSALVEFVKIVVDIAGYVAIAAAVVMLFVPGLDILASVALWATVVMLVGHTALAATGNGSWFDVALDVFALATFGMGKVAAEGLEATEEATAQAGERAAARGQQAYNQRLSSLNRRIATGTGRARTEAIAERAGMPPRPLRAAEFKNAVAEARATSRGVNPGQFGGDTAISRPYAGIRRAQELMPNSGGVAAASGRAARYAAIGRTGWSTGLTAAVADKVAGQSDLVPGHHGSTAYTRFKERFTHQVVPW